MKLLSVAYENNTYNIIYFKFFQEEKKNTLNSLIMYFSSRKKNWNENFQNNSQKKIIEVYLIYETKTLLFQ